MYDLGQHTQIVLSRPQDPSSPWKLKAAHVLPIHIITSEIVITLFYLDTTWTLAEIP